MDYSLNRLTSGQLVELFDQIPEALFHDLLKKNQKHFEKSKYIKGFRLDKLPKTIMHKVFSDEVLSMPNTATERVLISFIKSNFEDTNIEAIVEAYSDDVHNTAFLLEKELISNGFTISPALILLITKHSITDEEKSIIDKYHQLYLDNQASVIRTTKEKMEEKSNLKYNALLEEYDKVKEDLSIARKEVSTLDSNLSFKESVIIHKEEEVIALTSRLKAANIEIDKLKNKLDDYNEQVRIITGQALEIKSLVTQNEELQNTISNLSTSILTPNCVIEMCADILDDLKQETLGTKELAREIKKLFSKNESVSEAWQQLSEKEMEKMENIILLMNENKITHNDIELLEDVESYIHIKYMIVKSLIVVFYKYLEQNASQKTLVSKFINHNS